MKLHPGLVCYKPNVQHLKSYYWTLISSSMPSTIISHYWTLISSSMPSTIVSHYWTLISSSMPSTIIISQRTKFFPHAYQVQRLYWMICFPLSLPQKGSEGSVVVARPWRNLTPATHYILAPPGIVGYCVQAWQHEDLVAGTVYAQHLSMGRRPNLCLLAGWCPSQAV